MDQDLKTYLDQQFNDLRQETNRRFDEFQQETDRRFDAVDRRIDKAHDGIHQNRILIEKMGDTIQNVAEGVVSNRELIHRLIDETHQRYRESDSLMGGAHGNLELRVTDHDEELEKLGRRVDALEAA